jgi:hypothetical protein
METKKEEMNQFHGPLSVPHARAPAEKESKTEREIGPIALRLHLFAVFFVSAVHFAYTLDSAVFRIHGT